MIPVRSEVVCIDGVELLAEAMLNNCSGLWTATVVSGPRLVATGAGSSPEQAIAVAAERARSLVARS